MMDLDTVEDSELQELVEALLDKELDERPRLPGYEPGGDELSDQSSRG